MVTESSGSNFAPALWLLSGQLAVCSLLMVCFPEPGPGGALAPPWWVPVVMGWSRRSMQRVGVKFTKQTSKPRDVLGIALVKQEPWVSEGPVVPHA